jgi:hypothetical protein
MRVCIKLLAIFSLFLSCYVHAWIPNGETVTIDEIIQWNGDGPVYFKLSSGYMCYVPAAEKNAYSLILALYMSGKKASIHCFDSEETLGGFKGHKLHRIIAVKQ